MDLYAVMGNPIQHSLSPILQTAFAKQVGQTINYEKILVPDGGLLQALQDFQQRDGKGLSITVPCKEQAWDLVDERTEHATLAGAVSVIRLNDDYRLSGANFDGVGMVRDIKHNLGVALKGKRILLIGAGGAARGAILPLIKEKPAVLIIANRTPEKAQTLVNNFESFGVIESSSLEDLEQKPFDIIINATSASLHGNVPAIPNACVGTQTCCYDMMYSKQATAFMQWATQQGAGLVSDGLGMLIEQGVDSFEFWRGVRPKAKPLFDILRNAN